jgi:hypothetical protein
MTTTGTSRVRGSSFKRSRNSGPSPFVIGHSATMMLTYHRGHVTVIDGPQLEAASCECYRVATDLLLAVTNGRA